MVDIEDQACWGGGCWMDEGSGHVSYSFSKNGSNMNLFTGSAL